MFLNIIFPGSKTWKPYWVEFNNGFLDISTEYGKDPFTSFHIGVIKVRPSKDYPDRPDVLEFYPDEGYTKVQFWVFTYDPFDILEFFKAICSSYKQWREAIQNDPTPTTFTCDVKPSGLFSSNTSWSVTADRISISKKSNEEPLQIPLSEITGVTPSSNPAHVSYFRLSTKQNPDQGEYRCVSLDNMKSLLKAIYTNKFISQLKQSEGGASATE